MFAYFLFFIGFAKGFNPGFFNLDNDDEDYASDLGSGDDVPSIMLLGNGEVPEWTVIDEATTEMSWTSGSDPWDDFDLEFQQEPKSIWGWFADDTTTLETTTESLVCLEWSWFGFCKLYGPSEMTTTTLKTTSTTTSTTTTTTTTTSTTSKTFFDYEPSFEIQPHDYEEESSTEFVERCVNSVLGWCIQSQLIEVNPSAPITTTEGYFDTINDYLDNLPDMNQVSETIGSIGTSLYSGVQSGYESVVSIMPKSGMSEMSGDFSGDNDVILDGSSEGSGYHHIEPVGPISDRNETVLEGTTVEAPSEVFFSEEPSTTVLTSTTKTSSLTSSMAEIRSSSNLTVISYQLLFVTLVLLFIP